MRNSRIAPHAIPYYEAGTQILCTPPLPHRPLTAKAFCIEWVILRNTDPEISEFSFPQPCFCLPTSIRSHQNLDLGPSQVARHSSDRPIVCNWEGSACSNHMPVVFNRHFTPRSQKPFAGEAMIPNGIGDGLWISASSDTASLEGTTFGGGHVRSLYRLEYPDALGRVDLGIPRTTPVGPPPR